MARKEFAAYFVSSAVAMLVSRTPHLFEVDQGAYGLYSFEVMDTCRPKPELETGDSDLSLLSYLDCVENAYAAYADKIDGVDFQTTFDYFAFHTPFAGMVKGAHRKLMRQVTKLPPDVIEEDYQRRVKPSFKYCVQVGNVYSATTYLALAGLIDAAELEGGKRVGLFSYGSGCSSEFYSGVITADSQTRLRQMNIKDRLNSRYQLSMAEYDAISDINETWMFGIENKTVDITHFQALYDQQIAGKGLLTLREIKGYHREYDWS